ETIKRLERSRETAVPISLATTTRFLPRFPSFSRHPRFAGSSREAFVPPVAGRSRPFFCPTQARSKRRAAEKPNLVNLRSAISPDLIRPLVSKSHVRQRHDLGCAPAVAPP